MAKINTLSPYFINITTTNITSAVLDIYIYSGTQVATMDSITYTLQSDAYNGLVQFEISNLIADYLDTTYNGTYNSGAIWVNYQITETIIDVVQTPSAVVQLEAFTGYGYFDEGINPQLSNRLLQSNTTVYTLGDNYFSIPIQQNYLTQVDLKYQGSVVETQTFTPTTNSADIIRYIAYTTPSGCATATNYLFEDNDNYLFEDVNVFVFSTGTEIDEVLITYSDTATESVTIKTVDEGKYTPYKLTFINKFGALQSVWMFKRSDIKMNVESENYRSYLVSNGSYSVSDHQYRNFNVSGKESITLNSGFYTENYNEVFRQMMLSEKVWIYYDSKILPVNIKSKDLSFKTQLNDKLIDYKFEFEFAFDKINSVY
jgi:hypothetical protein